MSAPCPALGFNVTVALRANADEADIDVLVDSLLDFLESHGLQTGGAGDTTLQFVVTREGGQATDADRALVHDWATRWAEQAEISIGDIVDLGDPT